MCCWSLVHRVEPELQIDDPEVNNVANAVIYGTFAVSSLLAPAVCAKIGPRLTLFLGCIG
jgi:hypothetical protein